MSGQPEQGFERNMPVEAAIVAKDESLTWSLLDDVRRIWPRKLFVKGLVHPEDAVRAVSGGAEGTMVSNHDARQLDRAPAPIDVLPAIRAAVGNRAEVTLDGAVRRGPDIVTALCLGADAVFIGRPALYGAVVGGSAGVRKVLDILASELQMVLGQMGCPRTTHLGPHFIMGAKSSGTILRTNS